MALSKPVEQFSIVTDEHALFPVVTEYLRRSIEQNLEKLGLSGDRCFMLTASFLKKGDVSIRLLIASVLNSPRHETDEERVITIIEELALRLRKLTHSRNKHDKGIANLLVSIPLGGKVQLDGASNAIDQATLRRLQFEEFADCNPNFNGKNLHGPDSNAALIEVKSDHLLYSALDKFLETMSTLPLNTLFIVFNGHAECDGTLVFAEGRKTKMESILDALQTFRQNIVSSTPLQYLHVIFAQCYSYKLNLKVAAGFSLIDNMTWLTEDNLGSRFTHNMRTQDGSYKHVQLAEWKGQRRPFNNIYQVRKFEALQNENQELKDKAERAEGLEIENQKLKDEIHRLRKKLREPSHHCETQLEDDLAVEEQSVDDDPGVDVQDLKVRMLQHEISRLREIHRSLELQHDLCSEAGEQIGVDVSAKSPSIDFDDVLGQGVTTEELEKERLRLEKSIRAAPVMRVKVPEKAHSTYLQEIRGTVDAMIKKLEDQLILDALPKDNTNTKLLEQLRDIPGAMLKELEGDSLYLKEHTSQVQSAMKSTSKTRHVGHLRSICTTQDAVLKVRKERHRRLLEWLKTMPDLC